MEVWGYAVFRWLDESLWFVHAARKAYGGVQDMLETGAE